MDAVRLDTTVVHRCTYHIVWCPKYRRKVTGGQVEQRLTEIITQVCDEHTAPIVDVETMPDHVHLHVSVDQQYGIHRLVKQIKGRSSRLLRDAFPHLKTRIPTLWTNAYFVATAGGPTLDAVKHYIENQRNA